MNYVYVAFISPKNKMGTIIRLLTKSKYSHTALSLDSSLNKMYSFARRKRSAPFAGGFVVEHPSRYLSDKGDIPLKIVALNISDEKYSRLVSILNNFEIRSHELIYNTIDVISSSLFHLPVPLRDCFSCVSFVCYLLDIKKTRSIYELEKLLSEKIIYMGNYREYINETESVDYSYFEPLYFKEILALTLIHFANLFKRFLRRKA